MRNECNYLVKLEGAFLTPRNTRTANIWDAMIYSRDGAETLATSYLTVGRDASVYRLNPDTRAVTHMKIRARF